MQLPTRTVPLGGINSQVLGFPAQQTLLCLHSHREMSTVTLQDMMTMTVNHFPVPQKSPEEDPRTGPLIPPRDLDVILNLLRVLLI